jgi:hypothetical protein
VPLSGHSCLVEFGMVVGGGIDSIAVSEAVLVLLQQLLLLLELVAAVQCCQFLRSRLRR